jgi:type IV secretion system protein TrbL
MIPLLMGAGRAAMMGGKAAGAGGAGGAGGAARLLGGAAKGGGGEAGTLARGSNVTKGGARSEAGRESEGDLISNHGPAKEEKQGKKMQKASDIANIMQTGEGLVQGGMQAKQMMDEKKAAKGQGGDGKIGEAGAEQAQMQGEIAVAQAMKSFQF